MPHVSIRRSSTNSLQPSSVPVANSVLPPSGVFGLVDYVAGLGLFTIFLSVVMSLVSSHICIKKEDKTMSYVFDRVMFLALTICCVAANVLLPWSARG